MSSVRHVALIALAGLVLAGCGGGGTVSTVPPAQSQASAGRQPQITQQAGTLYVADHWGVSAFNLTASGTTSPTRSFVPHPKTVNEELIQGLATAPDGTLAVLQNKFVGNTDEYCRVVMMPSTADTGTPPLGTYLCDPNVSQAETITRGANGFDLVYRQGGQTTSPFLLQHMGQNGVVSSTLTLPSGLYDGIGATAGGGDYVGNINGTVLRYAAGATDGTVTQATFTAPGGNIHAMATSPDHTLYVATGPFGNESIYAFAKNATTATRTIGPFTTTYVTAMTVDAQNLLYVGLPATNNGLHNQVNVYAADANGNATPVRTLTDPRPNLEIFGLAISQP